MSVTYSASLYEEGSWEYLLYEIGAWCLQSDTPAKKNPTMIRSAINLPAWLVGTFSEIRFESTLVIFAQTDTAYQNVESSRWARQDLLKVGYIGFSEQQE